MRLTILHTNDIHGRQERIAQIATLVRREKEQSAHPVLYLDAGDVEETTNRLSNLTKGSAMHRLLGHAACDAATVGNSCWIRYGAAVLEQHARVSPHPQLLANFDGVAGPVPWTLLGEVGVFGLSAPHRRLWESFEFGFGLLDEVATARQAARELRARGATFVVCLSHLGLEVPFEPWDDRRLAAELQDDIDLLIGAHTHDLLPEGEWIGRVPVAQAGEFGEHLGRVEIDGDRLTAVVEPVPGDTPPYEPVLEEIAAVEREVETMLAEEIGTIDGPLDAHWIADMLRRRMSADVGLCTEGMVLEVLPPGPVTRGALWEASTTPGNPGVAELAGEQLLDVLRRGNDPAFVASTARALRGRPRGGLVIAGLREDEIDPARTYRVAGSDWELDAFGGYAKPEWGLRIRYDAPTIIREAIEEDLRR